MRGNDRMKSWRTIAVLLLCLVLVGSMACDIGGEQETELRFEEVVRADLTVSVSGSGNVEVTKEARLVFGSGGKIDRIYVEESDEVIEGDVLAELDTGALELALTQAIVAKAQAEAARENAEYNLKQLKDVLLASHDRIKVAETQLEALKLQVEASEQAIAQAQKQLDEATIIAPFDGMVAGVYAKEKDIVPPPTMAPQSIIHLIDPSCMELKVEVDEVDIPDVRLNQRAIIELDALPALLFEGDVVAVNPIPVAQGGVVSYNVTIRFDVPEGYEPKIGMSATADIVTSERKNVLLVPNRAVGEDSEGRPTVKVRVDEQIEERLVVLGMSDGFDTEIVDGLEEGEVIAIETRVSSTSGTGLF